MKYLLDTCVISDFVKGEAGTLKKIKALSPSEIAVSSITLMELLYGLELNLMYANKIKPILTDLFLIITQLEFTAEDAKKAANIRACLRAKGSLIGSYDILIAATALSNNLILVTSNMKEFQRVENLIIENWRS